MSAKIAVVTGANKGIGFQIVKDLAKQFDGLVYLTSRNEELGKKAMGEAAKELGAPGDRLRYHQLDLTDNATITTFAEYLKKEHGHIDILVNNAGIAFKGDSTASFAEQATVTNKTNYYGTKAVCDALFPLLAPGARVVNVASRVATMAIKKASPDIANAFTTAKSIAEVDKLMDTFISMAQTGAHKEAGYPDTSYGMSKLGELVLSVLQAQILAKDSARPDIVLNAMCPGYVDTDMSSHKGKLTVVEGADSAIYLALLPPNNADNPVGQFVANRKVIDWRKGQTMEEAFGGK